MKWGLLMMIFYKMYYLLLNYKIDTLDCYNVYLDIKDSFSAQKVRKLKEVLNTNMEYSVMFRISAPMKVCLCSLPT